jgi:outer membrane protein assembly factor BamB
MNIGRILIFWSFLTILCLASGCASSISEPESVLTQHNDRARTGVFRNETELTPWSVRNLKPLYTRKVNGQIAAQPLFVKGVMIDGVKKNVLYVVTRMNYIYAFDVDNEDQNDPRNGLAWRNPIELTHCKAQQPNVCKDNSLACKTLPRLCKSDAEYCKQHLGDCMTAQPLPGMDDGAMCQQTHGPVGITSTPVIDPEQQVMYVVFRVGSPPGTTSEAHHFLAMIDIRTGRELRRIEIAAPNVDDPHRPRFEATQQLNRPGLLLMRNPKTKTNVLYVAFAAPVCDGPGDYDGWVFAYSAPDLRLLDTYVTAPQTHGAGIWQSGGGLAGATVGGAVYATTGNNLHPGRIVGAQSIPGDQDPSGREYDRYDPRRTDLGDSILKLKLGKGDKFECASRANGFCVTDHFTAGNWFRLDTGYRTQAEQKDPPNGLKTGGDSDLGSGGPVVLANGWVIAGGKQGTLYAINPADMHHAKQAFQFSVNTWHQWDSTHRECRTIPSSMADKDGGHHAINPSENEDCRVEIADYDFEQSYGPNIHGAPVVWQRSTYDFGYVYVMGEKDYLRAYRVYQSGRFEEQAAVTTKKPHRPTAVKVPRIFPNGLRSPDGMPGGALSLSANGDKDGVVWVSLAPLRDATSSIEAGILMAFDAETLELLWSSEPYDDGGQVYFAKFVPPTIAYGRVFRATFGDHDVSCTVSSLLVPPWSTCGSVIVYGVRRRPFAEPKFR